MTHRSPIKRWFGCKNIDTSLEVVKSNCCMVLIPREMSYYEWVIAELTHRSPIKDLRSEPSIDVRLVLQPGYRRSYVSRGCQIKLLYGFDPSRDVVLHVGYRRNDTPVPDKGHKILSILVIWIIFLR